MIQVSTPASATEKNFDYNAEVELINPITDTVATATYMGADVDWYIKAEDILLKQKNQMRSSSLNSNKERGIFINVASD